MVTESIADSSAESGKPSNALLVRTGFVAMLPLWAGAIPFGIAYSIAGLEAGFQPYTIQLMSLTVFSAAAQISTVALHQAGSSTLEVLVAAGALNVHLLLIGAAVAREIPLSLLRRTGVALLLTDASYAIAASQGRLRTPILVGAGLSMYLGWNLGTMIGLIAGQAIPDPRAIAIDLVVPLTFLAVLMPMLRGRMTVIVAAGSAAGTLLLSSWLPLGFAILLASVCASIVAAWWTSRADLTPKEAGNDA